jgi:hypothetical protein
VLDESYQRASQKGTFGLADFAEKADLFVGMRYY